MGWIGLVGETICNYKLHVFPTLAITCTQGAEGSGNLPCFGELKGAGQVHGCVGNATKKVQPSKTCLQLLLLFRG